MAHYQSIDALLLAAGMGTRLRPLTNTIPKCLVNIGDKPVLEYWLEYLEMVGCQKILVNTHYHSGMVENYLNNYKQMGGRRNIFTTFEPNLLGTAGTLLKNRKFFSAEICMLIHADNMTDFDIKELINAHNNRPSECIITMLTFKTENPESCGIVQTDSNGILQTFHEKTSNPPGDIANGAVYVFDSRLFDFIDSLEIIPHDFSADILPRMIGKIYTFQTFNPFIDIGTFDNLKRARKIWSSAN